jgi:hypothetical protein
MTGRVDHISYKFYLQLTNLTCSLFWISSWETICMKVRPSQGGGRLS